MIDRFEATFHPEMREQLIRGDNPSMRNLETWVPWQQLYFCPPYGADEHPILLRTTEAHTSAETEESRVIHDGTRLFQDLAAKSLLPGLTTLGSAPRPPPVNTVIADQHDLIVRGDAESICAMRCPGGDLDWRMPGSQPIAAVRANCKFFAISCRMIPKCFHLEESLFKRLQHCP